VHEEIADLLRQLRRLQDLQVVLQLDVLTVTDASLKTIPVDLDSVQGDKVSHLSEIQVGRIREFAEKSHGAAFTNCAKVTFFNGQVAELTLRRQMLKSANRTVPLPPLHFVPMISADQSSVRLKIAIGATQPLEALARSREYVITLGQSLLADITNDLDSYQIPGLPGIVAETLLRERKKPPAERVLMFITPRVIVQEEEELINVKPR
jgi:hypothetical protein